MKKYAFRLLFLVLIAFAHTASAIVEIDSIKILPKQPVKNDVVQVMVYISTTSVSKRIFQNTQFTNNTFSIESCYSMQGSPAETFYSDTLNMGALPAGTYKILVICHNSLDFNQCTYLDTLKDSLIFVIPEPEHIPSVSSQSCSIYPNPATNTLYIHPAGNITLKEAVIYNTYGVLMGNYDGKEPIDVSAYAPGMYFIHINTGQGSYSQKFIKQ